MSASGRRPIVRWAWRLFKRDWRQQTLVIGLLTFAVAVVLFSTVAVSNALPLGDGEFGDAAAVVTFEAESAEQIAADIAALREANGVVEAIGHRRVEVQGAVETLDVRAQQPGGPLGAPMLALRQGRYPASAAEIALTDGAAELLRDRPRPGVRLRRRAAASRGHRAEPGRLRRRVRARRAPPASSPNPWPC